MKTLVIKLTMVVVFAVLLSSRPGFADDIVSEVQVLRPQLRPVDLTILPLMKSIEKKRTEETDVKDEIEERQDQEQR